MGEKIKKEKNITLTKDQQIAVEECEAYVNGTKYKDKKWVTISGIGGSGKTTIAKYIIDDFPKDSTVYGAAISHQAVRILGDFLQIERVMTIAKLLNKKPIINKKTGVKEFKIIKSIFEPLPIESCDLLIIDEASMIDDQLLKDILTHAKKKCKIIFLGDIAQLMPIEGDENELSKTFNNTIANLDQIIRAKAPLSNIYLQYRNHILDNIRNNNELNTDNLIFKDDIRGLFNIDNEESLIKEFIKNYDSNDLNYAKIISYTNKSVDYYNKEVRKRLFGSNIDQYVKGDILLSKNAYRNGIVKNNEYVKVLTTPQKARMNGILCYKTDLENNYGAKISDVFILDQNNLKSYYQQLNEFKNKNQWKKFYKMKDDTFFNCSYGFCSTSYKIQGSTISKVFIDGKNQLDTYFASKLQKFQSLYVSISRSKESIYLLR